MRSHQPRLGQPQNGVNRNFSWLHMDKWYVFGKLSMVNAKLCSHSMMGKKDKHYSTWYFLHENMEKFHWWVLQFHQDTT